MSIKMNKLSTGRILLLILLFLSMGLGSHIATADPDQSTTIDLGSYTTYTGSNVTVPIKITNATEIAGGSVNISFNASIVSVQAILAGDFGTPVANINNTNGFVRVAVSRPTAVGKENASLAGIRFKGILKGITTLNITNASLNYENGTVFIPETSNGMISVSTPPVMYITSYDVRVDSNVTVPIEIKNATDIAGGSAKIVFDASIVNVQMVSSGHFGTPEHHIDNTNGSVHVAVATTTAVGIEEAVLANIVFKGLSEGITALGIQDAAINDEEGNVIIPETVDGEIYVYVLAPVPTVLKPNGGEEIPSGSIYDIKWNVSVGTYSLAINPLNISYSTDGGTTWDSIAADEPNDGRYHWDVPNIDPSTSNCLIKVEARDTHGNTGNDTSDSVFIILHTTSSENETIPAGETETVEGPPESDTTVEVTAAGEVTITVAYYSENPHQEATKPAEMLDKYIDVAASDNDNVTWPMYVKMNYTDDEIPAGVDESTLGLYHYKDGAWHRCGDTGVNADENYVWANVAKDECAGSPFCSGGSSPPVPVPVPEFSPIGLIALIGALSFVLVVTLRRKK